MGFNKATDRVIGSFQIPSSYNLSKTVDCNNEYEVDDNQSEIRMVKQHVINNFV